MEESSCSGDRAARLWLKGRKRRATPGSGAGSGGVMMGAGGEALQKGVQRAYAAIGEKGCGNPLCCLPETKLSGGVGENEPRGKETLGAAMQLECGCRGGSGKDLAGPPMDRSDGGGRSAGSDGELSSPGSGEGRSREGSDLRGRDRRKTGHLGAVKQDRWLGLRAEIKTNWESLGVGRYTFLEE